MCESQKTNFFLVLQRKLDKLSKESFGGTVIAFCTKILTSEDLEEQQLTKWAEAIEHGESEVLEHGAMKIAELMEGTCRFSSLKNDIWGFF